MQPPESTIKRSVSGYLLVISSENQGSPHGEPSRFNHINCWTMKMLVWVAHRGGGSRKEWINRLLVYHLSRSCNWNSPHLPLSLQGILWNKQKLDPQIQGIHQENPILTYFGYAGIFQQQASPILARLRWIPCNTAACRFDAPPEVSGSVGPHAAAEAAIQPATSHESCQGVAVGKSYVGYRLGIYAVKGANVPKETSQQKNMFVIYNLNWNLL